MQYQYLVMFKDKPINHTLSKNYFNTQKAKQSYINGYQTHIFNSSENINSINIIGLNETTLNDLLNTYSLLDLQYHPQYNTQYWHNIHTKECANKNNQITKLKIRYDKIHGKNGVSIIKHSHIWWKLSYALLLFSILSNDIYAVLSHQLTILHFISKSIAVIILLTIWFLMVFYGSHYLIRFFTINREFNNLNNHQNSSD